MIEENAKIIEKFWKRKNHPSEYDYKFNFYYCDTDSGVIGTKGKDIKQDHYFK